VGYETLAASALIIFEVPLARSEAIARLIATRWSVSLSTSAEWNFDCPLIINDQFEKRNLSDSEIVEKLKLIGCTLKNKEYGWDVAVIPNRSHDLIREIDLIEEIARLIGYDRFDLNLPNPIKPGKLSSEQLALRKVKNGFIENGFNEVLSYSLVPEDNEKLIKISNPLLLETSCLRDNIWKEHLEIVNRNIKAGQTSCYIYEIGNVFYKNTY